MPIIPIILPFILERLAEPSTAAGIAAVAGALGFHPAVDLVHVVTGVAGLFAIFMPERGGHA